MAIACHYTSLFFVETSRKFSIAKLSHIFTIRYIAVHRTKLQRTYYTANVAACYQYFPCKYKKQCICLGSSHVTKPRLEEQANIFEQETSCHSITLTLTSEAVPKVTR